MQNETSIISDLENVYADFDIPCFFVLKL